MQKLRRGNAYGPDIALKLPGDPKNRPSETYFSIFGC